MASSPDRSASVHVWRVSGAIAAALLLAYVVALAAFSPTTFPAHMTGGGLFPYLMDKPVGEDGYYMLTVSQNIAEQGHVAYNGAREVTGIQPLATVAFAGLDWIVQRCHGDRMDLIRSVLILGGVLLLIFAAQIASITGRLVPQESSRAAMALAFLLVVSDYTLFRLFTYGLETGLYLIFLAICVQSTQRIVAIGRTTTREAIALGFAAGFAGETRIDFGLIFGGVLLILLLKRWIDWTRAALAGAIALLLVSPWFLFVHRVDGTWLPSSGRAESTLITLTTMPERLERMLFSVIGHLVPWSYAGMSSASSLVGLLSILLMIWMFRNHRAEWSRHASRTLSVAGVWLPSFLVLIVIYVVLFNAMHFYYRYSSILTVLSIPLAAAVLAATPLIRRYAVVVPVVLLLCFCTWTYGALHTGHLGNSQAIVAGYVQRNYPNARVGAFQSGVVGFFNNNVENLDGKLNPSALEAEREHRLPAFLDEQKVDVITDWDTLIHAYLPQDYIQRTFEPCPVPMTSKESICLIRRSMRDSGQLQAGYASVRTSIR